MKTPFFHPRGPLETPFTRLSELKDDVTSGGIQRIDGFANMARSSSLSPKRTIERQIDVLKTTAGRIITNILNGRDTTSGLKDFDSIALEVRNHLEEMGIDVSGSNFESSISQLRKEISGEAE